MTDTLAEAPTNGSDQFAPMQAGGTSPAHTSPEHLADMRKKIGDTKCPLCPADQPPINNRGFKSHIDRHVRDLAAAKLASQAEQRDPRSLETLRDAMLERHVAPKSMSAPEVFAHAERLQDWIAETGDLFGIKS